ncbi:MAG: hypothetical protein F4Y44_02740 [Chloroflexi bacterium]|nr:hypothetical protein [Chloroflexota bacterium]
MTTNDGRSVEDYTAQALKFIAQSEAEFGTGDDRQGAEKLYGAATQAIIAASKQRGWGYRSHRDNKNAATRLAAQYNDILLSAGLLGAERFHIHFHHGDMENWEIEESRPIIHGYVLHLVDLIHEYERNGHRDST